MTHIIKYKVIQLHYNFCFSFAFSIIKMSTLVLTCIIMVVYVIVLFVLAWFGKFMHFCVLALIGVFGTFAYGVYWQQKAQKNETHVEKTTGKTKKVEESIDKNKSKKRVNWGGESVKTFDKHGADTSSDTSDAFSAQGSRKRDIDPFVDDVENVDDDTYDSAKTGSKDPFVDNRDLHKDSIQRQRGVKLSDEEDPFVSGASLLSEGPEKGSDDPFIDESADTSHVDSGTRDHDPFIEDEGESGALDDGAGTDEHTRSEEPKERPLHVSGSMADRTLIPVHGVDISGPKRARDEYIRRKLHTPEGEMEQREALERRAAVFDREITLY